MRRRPPGAAAVRTIGSGGQRRHPAVSSTAPWRRTGRSRSW
uniref:Cl146_1 n=1 Tax=Arundo donax TaxID=35708 RepID=A0A0A9CWD3_ARUDO